MLAHKKNQRSWVGNDPQQEPHVLGQKHPTTTDIVIGWVLNIVTNIDIESKPQTWNVNALRPKTTQILFGHQPTAAMHFGHQTENSDAVGIDSHPHEHMEFGWLSAHSNKHSICTGIALQEQVWYLDRRNP